MQINTILIPSTMTITNNSGIIEIIPKDSLILFNDNKLSLNGYALDINILDILIFMIEKFNTQIIINIFLGLSLILISILLIIIIYCSYKK